MLGGRKEASREEEELLAYGLLTEKPHLCAHRRDPNLSIKKVHISDEILVVITVIT